MVSVFEKSSNVNSIFPVFENPASWKFMVLSRSKSNSPLVRLRYAPSVASPPVVTLNTGGKVARTFASSFAGGFLPPGSLTATS